MARRLTDEEILIAQKMFLRPFNKNHIRIEGVTKEDLRQGLKGADAYVADLDIEMNQAIPQPLRGALTIEQKIDLYNIILDVRSKEVYGN